jgi:hypothetical protein
MRQSESNEVKQVDLKTGPNRSEKNGQESMRREVDERAKKPDRAAGQTPKPGTELASYWVSSGERLLICAIGKSGLEIHDVDADFLGESFRVERAFEDNASLWAMVDDYLAQARRLDAPPMSGAAISAVILGDIQ